MQPVNEFVKATRWWWWSPHPFYTYVGADVRGWGRAVEVHPGAFNLMWAAAGGPDYYIHRAEDQPFCMPMLSEAPFIPIKRQQVVRLGVPRNASYTVADAAFELPLPKFIKAYSSSPWVRAWSYSNGLSHVQLLRRFRQAEARMLKRA